VSRIVQGANGAKAKHRTKTAKLHTETPITQTEKKRGRKPGKHSDVNYTQTSLYLPIELRNKVRAKLYEQGAEFSGLVENMLRDWLSRQA
jgi:hypothetical protein